MLKMSSTKRTRSAEELATSASDNDHENNTEDEPLVAYTSPSSGKPSLNIGRLITIEPVTFLESVSYGVSLALRPQFLQERIGEDFYNYSFTNNQSDICSHNSTESNDIADQIQADTSLWLMYLSVSSYFPAMIATIVIGTLSDSIGRKLALIVPLIGFIIQNVTFLIVLQYYLPLWVLLIGDFVQGCTGGVALLICGSMSYIADITSPSQRTWRIVVVEMTLFVGGGAMQIINGYILDAFGYKIPVWIAIGLLIMALLYVIIPPFLIETVKRAPISRMFLLKVYQDARDLFKDNTLGRRWKLILLNIQIVIIDTATIQFFAIQILFVIAYPFCWTPVLVGYITAASFFTTGIGMLVGSKLFSLCFSDYWILHIACLSAIVSMTATGLSWYITDAILRTIGIFIATTLGSLRTLVTPIVRSSMSKLVAPNEQGAMFAFQNSVENVGVILSPLLLNAIYAATVSTVPSTVFYVIAVLHCLPMLGIGLLQISDFMKAKESL